MEQLIEVEGSTLDEARRLATSQVPPGLHLWSEDVLCDGRPQALRTHAPTEAAAMAAISAQLPPGAKLVECGIRVHPGHRVVEAAATDEPTARQQVEASLDGTAHVVAVRLKEPGRPGFLGFGRKPGRYDVEVEQEAVAEGSYSAPARLRLHVGDSRLRPTGHCQRCGNAGGRVKVASGKANYYCSPSCEEAYNRAAIRAAISGAVIIGVNAAQYQAIQDAAATDRAYCWSCGHAMPMTKKACPRCRSDQHPAA